MNQALRRLSIRTRLVAVMLVLVLGQVLLGVVSHVTLDMAKVGGPTYHRIVENKDLVADILPPPEYILESYLLVLQMKDETDARAIDDLVARGERLQKDYMDRHAVWQAALAPGPKRTAMLEDSFHPAIAFFDVRDRQLVPAVRAGKTADVAAALVALKASYEAHRAAIDRVVVMANADAAQDEAEAAQSIHARTRFLALAVLGLAVVGLVLGLAVAQSIVKPVEATVQILEAVAAGDMTKSSSEAGADEMTRISVALNRAVDATKGALATIQDGAERERRHGLALERGIDDILIGVDGVIAGDLTTRLPAAGDPALTRLIVGFGELIENLQRDMLSISHHAQTLASSSEELTASSREMASTSDRTSANAEVVAGAADQASKNVEVAAAAAEQMTASMKEISENARASAKVAAEAVQKSETTNQAIARLGQSSKEIGDVIKVINSIAEQTNLLALNATIEAARAGEAGKGFAVVANEVKDLAKETAKATGNVEKRVEAIQSDTREAIEAIADIRRIIDQVSGISAAIAVAVHEQAAATTEIARNVEEAARATTGIARNIDDVATSARGSAQCAMDTQGASGALAQLAAELQILVAKFKLTDWAAQDAASFAAPRPATRTGASGPHGLAV